MAKLISTRDVIIRPAPLVSAKVMQAPLGASVLEIVNAMYAASGVSEARRDYALMVEIDGSPLPRDRWHYVPDPGEHVLIFAPIRDGKDIGRSLLMLAVVIASAYTGQVYGPQLATSLFGMGTTSSLAISAATSAIHAASMTAGMYLVNAVAPIRSTSPASSAPTGGADAYSITGAGNSANRWGPVPVVLGTHRMFPLYGANPYTEIVGNDEYLRCTFVWGEGPLKIDSIRIGDTPLESFSDYEIETVEGRPSDGALTLIPESVDQQSISLELRSGEDPVVRQVPAGSDEISIDILFPTGCLQYTEDGAKAKLNVIVEAQYREVGAAGWTNVAGDYPGQEEHAFYVWEKTVNPLRSGRRWTVDRTKTYEVRLWKSWPEAKYEDNTRVIGYVLWTNLRGITDEHPVTYPRNLAMTALRIKATDQLNGMIDSLSGLVSSYAEVWDGEAWGGDEVTNNPAALVRLVLAHPANAKARSSSQIDDASLGAWYEFCEDNGYAFNQVRDFRSSVWDCVADIAAAGRGSPSLENGIWSVVWDNPDAPVVQHITPRNSWGFSAERSYYVRPHAFRVAFTNEDNDYRDDERIVLDDGYQIDGYDAFGNSAPSLPAATLFEAVEFPGITDPDLIWRFARFHIAQSRLRPEAYTCYMDFEHLGCSRGARVRVAHDAPLWGSKWGRITYLLYDETAENVTGVGVDERLAIVPPARYVIRVRRADADNTSQLIPLAEMDQGEYTAVTFETPEPIATAPEVGDLFILGEYGNDSTECIVTAVHRADDLTARIEFVDASDAIYDADTGTIPNFDTNITRIADITDIPPGVPAILAQSGTTTLEVSPMGSIRPRIFVTCSMPVSGVRVDRYRVRYRMSGSSQWKYAEARRDNPTAYCTDVEDGDTCEIQAQAISVYDVAGDWCAAISHIVIGMSQVPSDVVYFACNIVGSEAHLSWLPVPDIDLSHYRIRWSPLTEDAAWGDSVDVVERVGKPATSVTAPAMIGSYLIKAVDYAGNESTNPAIALANVSHIPGFTTAELLELPDGSWAGTGDGAEYNETFGGICLDISRGAGGADLTFADTSDVQFSDTADAIFADQSTEPITSAEGTYTFTDDVDLGAVFTSRVYAAMTTSAVNLLDDLYDHTDLYDVENLYGVDLGQCGIDLEMRFTSDDPGGTPTWSDWQRVLVGDYTARAFQFRAVLWTNAGEISPCLEAIDIYIDMADRVYPFDQAVEIGGSTIAYSPAFYAVPSVGIAVADGQAGDAYMITGHTRTGFTIAFTNGGSGVARTISGVARGYGEEET